MAHARPVGAQAPAIIRIGARFAWKAGGCYGSCVARRWLLLPLLIAWPPIVGHAADDSGLTVEQCLAQADLVFREIIEVVTGECPESVVCECMEARAAKASSHPAWYSGAGQCLNEHPDNAKLAELHSLLEEALALEKEYFDDWEEYMSTNLGENWSCDM